MQNRFSLGTREQGTALTAPASVTFAGKDCERDMNQLRSLPAAVAGAAGTGKALPSQRGDGDSCSAFQLYSLLFGAALPAGDTLH